MYAKANIAPPRYITFVAPCDHEYLSWKLLHLPNRRHPKIKTQKSSLKWIKLQESCHLIHHRRFHAFFQLMKLQLQGIMECHMKETNGRLCKRKHGSQTVGKAANQSQQQLTDQTKWDSANKIFWMQVNDNISSHIISEACIQRQIRCPLLAPFTTLNAGVLLS